MKYFLPPTSPVILSLWPQGSRVYIPTKIIWKQSKVRKNILGKWELFSSLFPFILFSFQRKKNKCKFFTGWTKFQMNSGSILWKKVNHKSKTDLLPTQEFPEEGIFKLIEARGMPQNKWPKIILSFLISNLNFDDQVMWLGLDFLIGLCWPDISHCKYSKPENAGVKGGWLQ